MRSFAQLSGKQRRNHLRLLRRILAPRKKFGDRLGWVRGETSFRMVERLHKAGLCTAAASKSNVFDIGNRRRPFRELAVYLDEAEAQKDYPHTVLPRRGGR